MIDPIVVALEKLLVGRLARTGSESVRRALLGSEVSQELRAAFERAVAAFVQTTFTDASAETRATLEDVFTAFVRTEDVAACLLDQALVTPTGESPRAPSLDVDALRRAFLAKGLSPGSLGTRFDGIPRRLVAALSRELETAASVPTNPLFQLLVVRRLGGIEASLTPSIPQEDPLERLRRVTEIAIHDATVVVPPSPDGKDDGISLDDVLYVPRTIEGELSRILAEESRSDGVVIILIGEAGRGKTTLLWRLRTLLGQRGQEVWLLKPTYVDVHTAADEARITRAAFLAASRNAARATRRLVVLFDTVDVLLHDAANRDSLLELVVTLRDEGAAVVLATRPTEAVALASLRPRPHRLTVGQYDPDELEAAIRGHVRRMYGEPELKTAEVFSQEIRAAVAAGLPLREVCMNPLTLRMLFDLYRPREIPRDINVHALYREYWSRRVESDLRGGSPVEQSSERDLSRAAQIAAMAMLSLGRPESAEAAVAATLTGGGCAADDLSALVSRGILQRSGRATIEFFHQTFFEHAAARGILASGRDEALTLLRDRVTSRAHDPFVSPIYEQALLLAADHPALSGAADAHLADLLASDDIAALLTAISVYTHRRTVPAACRARVEALLGRSDLEALTVRFIELSANTPRARSEELGGLLISAWRMGEWRIQERIFELLARLSASAPALARQFLIDVDALSFVLADVGQNQSERRLRDVLRVLAPNEAAWCWDALVRLYVASIEGRHPEGLRVAVIEVLCARASSFGEATVGSRFESAVITAYERSAIKHESRALHEAWGRLWAIEWASGRSPLNEILGGVPAAPEVGAAGRLAGVAVHLRDCDVAGWEHAWAGYWNDGDRVRRALWAGYVWRPLLSSSREHGAPRLSVLYERVSDLLGAWCSTPATTADWRIDDARTQILSAIGYADPAPDVFLELTAHPAFGGHRVWLDPSPAADLLGLGVRAGHPGAVAAAALLEVEPASYPVAARSIARALALATTETSRRALFRAVVVSLEDLDALGQAIERSDGMLDRDLVRDPAIARLLDHLRASRSSAVRAKAARLQRRLILDGAAPLPEWHDIARELRAECDPAAAGHLAALCAAAAIGSEDERSAVEFLAPFACGSADERMRSNALQGLVALVFDSADPMQYIDAVFSLIIEPPTDQGRLRVAGRVMSKLAEKSPRRAAAAAIRLLSAPPVARLGVHARRNLSNRIEGSIRAVLDVASLDERRQIVALAKTVDRIVGRVVIEACCDICFDDVRPELEDLLGEASVVLDLKRLIRDQQHRRQRLSGSSAWPELLRHLPPS